MPLLSNGQYRIFNAQFPTQDADLLFASSTGVIGGYVNNSNSFNMVWNLKNVADKVNQITLASAATSNEAYASIDQVTIGAGLRGSTSAAVWTLIPSPHSGQYWILAPSALNSIIPSGLVWSLPNDQNLTPLELAQIAPNNRTQVWSFKRQVGTVGNTDSVVEDLD